jgi:hypothetical protein
MRYKLSRVIGHDFIVFSNSWRDQGWAKLVVIVYAIVDDNLSPDLPYALQTSTAE